MNKRAFTLVELLAVIVILAIIALISVPMILNQIETAKKKALEDSAYGIIEAGKFFYLENIVTTTGINEIERYDFEVINQKFVNMNNGNQTLTFSGKMPKSGTLQITRSGKAAIAICDDKYCACKGITDTKVVVQETDCVIDKDTGEITSKVKDGTPTGIIVSYMGNKAPEGYLPCDGTVYNINDYPKLAEQIKEEFGSYNYHGGDGTTTFAVPDLRGEFLRGTGKNAHENQGNGSDVGIHQNASEVASIFNWENQTIGIDVGDANWRNNNYDSAIQYPIRRYKDIGISSASNSASTIYTTRPTNTSVLYCIKY